MSIYDETIADRNENVEFDSGAFLAPVLGAKRDGTASVDSSRGLLMSVLGELVLPSGGSVWTQTIVKGLELLGVSDKASRQAIARMYERGWLDRKKVGRQTRWSLTESASSLLTAGAKRIYTFGTEQRPWDGSWVVLLASVPEVDRHLRYRMTNGLGWAGFGSLGQGIWISPWIEQEQTAVQLLQELGIEATSFRSELGAMGSASRLANQAWDLDVLRVGYDGFLADTEPLIDSGPINEISDEVAATELCALVHRWRRFPFMDPDLPAALLPEDWPGPASAARFGALRTSLLAPAQRWWTETEASHTHTPATR